MARLVGLTALTVTTTATSLLTVYLAPAQAHDSSDRASWGTRWNHCVSLLRLRL